MKTGDTVQLNAHKSDGTCYRRWSVLVETARSERLSLVAPVGSRVWDIRGEWIQEYAIRAYCWPNQPYILNEVYGPDGGLAMIYVNINSPIAISGSHLNYTDYELDVVLHPPYRARIIDEDEFAEAAKRYCYSESFQRHCYEAARRGIGMAEGWVPGGAPDVIIAWFSLEADSWPPTRGLLAPDLTRARLRAFSWRDVTGSGSCTYRSPSRFMLLYLRGRGRGSLPTLSSFSPLFPYVASYSKWSAAFAM